jgi:small-conductance mechanosensitive channel
VSELTGSFFELLHLRLFTVGGAPFTLAHAIVALVSLLALLVLARRVRRWTMRRLAHHGKVDASTAETISALTQYLLITLGLLIILNEVGLKLSSITVLAGSLGVGVGFGLQNIFSNFVCGLIIMFERPVKIGDHIVVGGMEGNVVRIGMRATTLRSTQGSYVIVPNQSVITGNVINWDENYASNVVLQYRMLGAPGDNEALLLGIAAANPDILKSPAPSVYLIGVDHAGQILEVHFTLRGDEKRRLAAVSAFNKALMAELAARGQVLAPNP